MVDPTPVVGLPDAEYIELYNRTAAPVSLNGWKLSIGNRVTLLPDSTIPAYGYLLLCSRATLPFLQPYGRCAGLSSLSLPNTGSTLSLSDSKGSLQFSTTYTDRSWPADKREGGYALEMVDKNTPCREAGNWKASSSPTGGTPGSENAVNNALPDQIPPEIDQIEVHSASEVTVRFTERLDSNAIAAIEIEIPGRRVTSRLLETPSFSALRLSFTPPLLADQIYDLTLRTITDCAGNLARELKVPVGLPSEPDAGDILLNEILFNPRSDGNDFVEIFNNSSHFVNLNGWKLGNRKDGLASGTRLITASDFLFAPYSFLAMSIDSDNIRLQYPATRSRKLLTIASLPSYPNEAGEVTLLNKKDELMDYFNYQSSYHSPFIGDPKGVSLERLKPEAPTNEPTNWQSASSTVGFATPGYANSQGDPPVAINEITIEPEAFTPDGDGADDFTTLRFGQQQQGKKASVHIYDLAGRRIKTLLSNQLIGTTGEIRWDGTNEQGKIVATGYYLLLFETFDATGNTQTYKLRVVVAHR